MADVAVVGPGSVGVFFAAHLAAAGHNVVACARRPFDRYVVESLEFPIELDANVLIDPADVAGPVEWVLLAVKAHQTEGASAWLDALCTPDTKVMVVQNGIEHDRADPFINGASSIPTVVYCGAELLEPGRIAHTSSGHLFVPDEPFGSEMLALFEGSRAEVRPSDKFATHQWRKLSLNVMANGLTALTGRRLEVLSEPGIRQMAIDLLAECWTVAQHEGAELDPATAEALVDQIIGSGANNGTSMLYDTQAGRPTEHDAIHGAALRRAEHHGVSVPTVAAVHALLDARSQ
jgi:2-dehydropantoate 2-reductase